MVALLTFIIATLEIDFGIKKLWDVKGPVGDNVFKNPARYISGFFSLVKQMEFFNIFLNIAKTALAASR